MPAMSTSVNFLGANGVIADANVELDMANFGFACAMCLEFAAMSVFCRIFGLPW